MAQGVAQARGSWILFMDADTVLDSTALSRAVVYASTQQLSYLTIVPELNIPGAGAQAFLGLFGMLLAYSLMPLAMNTAFRHGSIGIGAFQLIARDAYDRVGGHYPIRYCIADDLSLARRCKQAGCRTRVLLGGPVVQLPWYATFSAAVHGFEKNFYSMAQFRLGKVVILVGFLSVFFYLPWILGLTGHVVGLAAGILGWAEYVHIGRQGVHPFGWRPVLLYPVMPLLLFYTLLRSAALAERQRGVWWRGRFYALADLRRRCP
jgi:GT2 family glycosyltransferase